MSLNTERAQQLFDAVVEASETRATTQPIHDLLNYLIEQLEELRVLANGYPRSSIDGNVWVAGKSLTILCDKLTDLLSGEGLPAEEEYASRLAVGMALQIMSHYPEEILPRIARNARCQEGIGGIDRAVELYDSVIGDFQETCFDELPEDSAELTESDQTVLSAVFYSIERLSELQLNRVEELKILSAQLERFSQAK
jgi:hypothetical protein